MNALKKGLLVFVAGFGIGLGGTIVGHAHEAGDHGPTQATELANGWRIPADWPPGAPRPTDEVPVLDRRGKPIVCPRSGWPLTIRLDAEPPQPLGSSKLVRSTTGGTAVYWVVEQVVPRCGPDGRAYWVPGRHADRVSAPKAFTGRRYPAD